MNVPDEVGVIVGWREWMVTPNGVLRPRFKTDMEPWPGGEAYHADCTHIPKWEVTTDPAGIEFSADWRHDLERFGVTSAITPGGFEVSIHPPSIELPNGYYWIVRSRPYHEEPPPKEDCACGIYLVNDRKLIDGGSADAYGECYGWGRVITHELGWRVEYAYPKRILLRNRAAGSSEFLEKIAQNVRENYGVPVEIVEEGGYLLPGESTFDFKRPSHLTAYYPVYLILPVTVCSFASFVLSSGGVEKWWALGAFMMGSVLFGLYQRIGYDLRRRL